MKVKMISCIMAVLILLGLFAACQQTASSPASQSQAVAAAEASEAQTTADTSVDTTAEDRPVIAWAANMLSHEFMQRVKTGMESRSADVGAELVVGDGNQDVSKQISDIENFVAQQVDAIVVTPVDNKALDTAVAAANEAGIPIIAEANKVAGTLTCVGANFVQHGYDTGAQLADLLPENVQAKILIIGLPEFEDCRQLVEGFKQAIDELGIDYEILAEVNGKGMKETALSLATDALTAHPEVNVIYGINDDSAFGGLQAYTAAGLSTDDLILFTHGFEGNAAGKAIMEDGVNLSGYAMFPEMWGFNMVDAATAAIAGETLPEIWESPGITMTAAQYSDYYSKVGDEYVLDIAAVKKQFGIE